jgi:signal transduction histidine kinase
VVGGTLVVSLLTAVLLATAAAFSASALWKRRELATMGDTADALLAAIQHEAEHDDMPLALAAPEAITESAVVGYRLEIWEGERLIVTNLPGATAGPPSASTPSGWLVVTRPIKEDVVLLVAAPKSRSAEVFGVIAWSFVLVSSVCLVFAVLVGRFVGLWATRPLSDFRKRIAALRPLDPLPPAAETGGPTEVRELQNAFHALWKRLDETVARELEFAANASHELRTSLTSIRLHAERARESWPKGVRELDAQLVELDRMVRLVDSLLVLSRDVACGLPRGEVVNLADVARAAVQRVFGGNGAARLQAPDEALVSGDEDLLGIAVENLLDNAKKFSRPRATVLVSVEQAGDHVRLSIVSPGSSVTATDRSRIFERFYRSAEARAGSTGHGLGLPLSRHIARLHGGDVQCLSQEEEDARFVLELESWRPSVSTR